MSIGAKEIGNVSDIKGKEIADQDADSSLSTPVFFIPFHGYSHYIHNIMDYGSQ